jgi:hypothetical protein
VTALLKEFDELLANLLRRLHENRTDEDEFGEQGEVWGEGPEAGPLADSEAAGLGAL